MEKTTLHFQCPAHLVNGKFIAYFYKAYDNGHCFQDEECFNLYLTGTDREDVKNKATEIVTKFNMVW